MREWFKRLMQSSIVSSVFYIVMGLILVLLPDQSVALISKVVFGVLMSVTGVYHIMLLLLEHHTATVLDLFSGVVMLVFGVFLFINSFIVVKLLPILAGAFVLADSLWTVKDAVKMKKYKRSSWKWMLLFGIVFVGLGVAVILNPFTLVRNTIVFSGAVLLGNGVMDVLFVVLVYFGTHKAKKDEIMESKTETDKMDENENDIKKSEQQLQNAETTGTAETGSEVVPVPEEEVLPEWKDHMES